MLLGSMFVCKSECIEGRLANLTGIFINGFEGWHFEDKSSRVVVCGRLVVL